ncbi:hypothetical protein [Chitinimonas sp. BJYL2]|uniref:hypothetical protein n=1 Tax=Chitinimonas sp. BJYL2 TaxID=2976696 RepID=UPI0022B3A549|nr:hypothetical protein [Chitinimonas sp. BJYL2]
MQGQLDARYDIDSIHPQTGSSRASKVPSWRWTVFFLLVLTAILLLVGLSNGAQPAIDWDGDLIGSVVGAVFAVVAVVFALLAFVLVLIGASLLVVMIVVGVLGVVFLALTPIWLPVLLAVAVLFWLVRKL